MNRETWLKERMNGIGGSEASAILGMNPYMTNVDLWKIKTGEIVRDVPDNKNMKYGREAERHLINLFALDYEGKYEVARVEPYTVERNKKYPFIFGTFDAKLKRISDNAQGILEIKTANILQAQHKERWNRQVPQNYYIQCLHYLLVDEKYKFAVLKAQLKTEFDDEIQLQTKHYFWERSDVQADLELLLKAEIKFWGSIKSGQCPDLVLPPI
jgi:putative phage-type endonuclease